MRREYIPDRGDIVWLNFTPHSGHEQAGKRPALVISPIHYNQKVGLAIFLPITSKIKGYPFEVILPEGYPIQGVILSDQIKSMDWQTRGLDYICRASEEVVNEVIKKFIVLLKQY